MKKILIFIILLLMPVITFASSATCKYKYANIELTINYTYGQKLTYSGTKSGNTSFGSLRGVQVSHIVDSSGNISCPTLYANKSISGQKKFDVDFTISNNSGYTAVEGTLNILVQDDKEKQSPDSNTHTCIYNKDTNTEYSLTWDGSKVIVSLIGSRFDNFCSTKITQSEWNASMFANGKCPTEIYDQIVSRYENLSNCKGRLIISTKTILTEDDPTTDVDGSENVYDGSNNENYKDNSEIVITPIKPSELDCDSLLGNPNTQGQPAFYLQIVFDVMKYLAIIIVIIFSVLDFSGAVASQDNDAIKKSTKKLIIRLVLCVVIFVLPTILEFVFTLIDVYSPSTCGIN